MHKDKPLNKGQPGIMIDLTFYRVMNGGQRLSSKEKKLIFGPMLGLK